MTRSLPVLGFALVALAGCGFIERSEHRRIGEVEASTGTGGAKHLLVRNSVGEVRVEAGSGDVVSATAVVYCRKDDAARAAGPEDLIVRAEGGTIRVENAHIDDADDDDWKMDLVVRAPAGLDLTVSHGVGDCTVRGSFGKVDLSIGVGDLVVKADAVGGGRANTGVGDLDLVVASSGPESDLDCKTGVGDLAIAVPASFGGAIAFETGVGDLSLENAGDVKVRQSGPNASAVGRVGASGPRLTGNTGTGDLSFARR